MGVKFFIKSEKAEAGALNEKTFECKANEERWNLDYQQH